VTDDETLEATEGEDVTDRWLKSTLQEIEDWRKKGALGKLHNFVVFIQRSVQRIQHFLALSSGRHLARDNSTRWNSWYHMLEVAILLQDVIEEYFMIHGEDEIKLDRLNAMEWSTLREIKDFLVILKQTTKSLEGHHHTLDRVIPSMDFILSHYEKAKITYANHDVLKNMVNSGWQKMEKYYSKTDESPAYAASVILNPTRKVMYMDNYWRSSWAESAKEAVRKLWQEEYKPTNTPNTNTPTSVTMSNEYELWLGAIDAPEVIEDEYEAYLGAKKVFGYLQPIDYWLDPKQKQDYPNLSRMAIDILSIPAMSSDPERAFSAAKITLTDRRNKLSIDMIECLECLKSWLSKDEWALDQEHCLKMKEDVLIGPAVVEQEGESIEQGF
jgi:hypothetical protein